MKSSKQSSARGTPARLDRGSASPLARPVFANSFPVVGVGASAGGIEGFVELLTCLPKNSGIAYILIPPLDSQPQAMQLAALAEATAMPVSQAADGDQVQPNHVYVIPPQTDMSYAAGRLIVSPRQESALAPHFPVDYFFRALAKELGSYAIGVLLSSPLSDGAEGLRAIQAEHGITLVQEPNPAESGALPRSPITRGVTDCVLAIPELASELVRLTGHPYIAAGLTAPPHSDATLLGKILSLLQSTVGVDFAPYKAATFERRLVRRMALRGAHTLEDYWNLLEGDANEARQLYEDVLIHVTSFFRDPAVFAALPAVFRAILEDKAEGVSIRLWSTGCSTGEEVYSLAIALLEFLGDSSRPIQIFGSDLNEQSIETARAGTYPDNAMNEVSEERRTRFFTKVTRGWRINKEVRDLCVFVQHDLAHDAPFSRLDLVSCRNVLLYFDQTLHKRIIPNFHYTLNRPGFLVLGKNEDITGFDHLFQPLDESNKIFARTDAESTFQFSPRFEGLPPKRKALLRSTVDDSSQPANLNRRLDLQLLHRYAPPGVLINEEMEIVQFRGQTDPYLRRAAGESQHTLAQMTEGDLLRALRTTLAQAKKGMLPAREDGVRVDLDPFPRTCNVVVIPLTEAPETKEQLYLVLFEEVVPMARETTAVRPKVRPVEASRDANRLLEHELARTKEYLQSLIEEQDRANENLGAANEELVCGNEELQSINEELETAKEELQTMNEELIAVNEELDLRNHEANLVNGDLVNLLDAVDIAILILDIDRRIRRFTPKARQVLNVLPSDVGRPLGDIKSNIEVAQLDRQIAEVIETRLMQEAEVRDRDGRWYRMQIRPHKTLDDKVSGAILSLVDIDNLKHHIGEAQEAKAEAERANRTKDQFLATLSHELRTPLASMLFHLQLLNRIGMTAAKTKHSLDSIERGILVQTQLIEDLLDVSRITTGKLKMEFEPVDLRLIVNAAFEVVRAQFEIKSLRYHLSLGDSVACVSGDRARLEQVVSNLLTNAVKFTPPNGEVNISLALAGDSARLQVVDTGVGIEPGFLLNVFHRFTQEDSSHTRTFGGLGLGLAIVRHLVESHGGTVQAESAGTGHGATFTVTLPLLAAPPNAPETHDRAGNGAPNVARAPPIAPSRTRLDQLRVLVVDDDPETREAVAEVLKLRGALVRVAASVNEGILVAGEFQPHALLCDIAMPGEDGYSFIRRLRDLGGAQGGDVPALALTALATPRDRQMALGAGFQMHLAKPVDVERLVDAVKSLVVK